MSSHISLFNNKFIFSNIINSGLLFGQRMATNLSKIKIQENRIYQSISLGDYAKQNYIKISEN